MTSSARGGPVGGAAAALAGWMAGSFVYRRGAPKVARSLGGAIVARRRGALVRGHEEEETGEQNTLAVVDPDVRRGSDRLRSATPPALVYLPPHETGALPFFCSCYSLCYRSAPERDLHVQSFTSVSVERLSLCLLLSSHGKQQKTLLEAPRSALVHLDQLLAEQVERGLLMLAHTRGRTALKKTGLCSPLETITGSVTTVDAQREDDIVESQWSLQTGLPCKVPSDKNGSKLWAWHFDRNEPPAWNLYSGDLDTFRTLFDPRFCRAPLLAGFLSLDLGPLLAFQAGDFKRDKNTPMKNSPDMEEHLAVIYERLRHELPHFFLKRHEYGMYSEDVEFENAILRMKTRGLPMYKAALTSFRFFAWNYFADVHMEVLKLTEHPENWSIQARWRVIGLPFHVLLFRFYKKDKSDLYRCYDAHSTFYLGADGLIRYHKVDKLMTAQPPVFKTKRLLTAILVALGMAEHRPSLNLLLSQPFFKTGQKHC